MGWGSGRFLGPVHVICSPVRECLLLNAGKMGDVRYELPLSIYRFLSFVNRKKIGGYAWHFFAKTYLI